MADGREQEYFKNRQEALTWLDENGYKVSRGKFYADCKKGFPYLQSDGSVSKYQVLRYGISLSEDRSLDITDLETLEFRHKREEAESRIAEMKADKMEKEASRDWISRIESYSIMAAIVGSLRDAVRQNLSLNAAKIVEVSGGDHERAAEAYEEMERCVDTAFNIVAGNKAEISFEGEDQ